MAATVRCPTCGRHHEWSTDNPWRPFCSDRCRLIDLGAWLEEKRGIPSEPAAESEAEPQPFVPHPQH